MTFDIAEVKARSRRLVHGLAAASASYEDDVTDPTPITVRWHNKIIKAETINDTSEIISGVDRLVFNEEELAALDPPVVLRRGGLVTIPKFDNMQFQLELEEPNDGPVTTAWSVSALT